MATIQERLYEIIAESLSVNIEDIKSDSSFIDDLDADSLDVVEMIMAMESEFSTDDNDLEISEEPIHESERGVVSFLSSHERMNNKLKIKLITENLFIS